MKELAQVQDTAWDPEEDMDTDPGMVTVQGMVTEWDRE